MLHINKDTPKLLLAVPPEVITVGGGCGTLFYEFEVWGEEMIDKKVKQSGNSGRVYLPPNWVGHQVKIIRID